MLLNKITNALKANFGNFLEPLKKIAQDLGQISAYAKDPEKKTLSMLEKRIDHLPNVPCTEETMKGIVGDIVFLEKETRAIDRLNNDYRVRMTDQEQSIQPTRDKIKTLDDESKKIRKKMTDPLSGIWERGKSVLSSFKRTPGEIAELAFTIGTARETKLLLESEQKLKKSGELSSQVSPVENKINKYKREINLLEQDKLGINRKIDELKMAEQNCAESS